ncbi:MAG: DUF1064 domain-containing protein [Kordiimonadaceae bacterium]|nr:DUF1064 domain-containing protein [Kordiimonadaceae bacterium]
MAKFRKHGRIVRSDKSRRTHNGIVFDSIAEMERYKELYLLFLAGDITEPEMQPPFVFQHEGRGIGSYKADFRYTFIATGEEVVEDVKGNVDALFRFKKKMMFAFYPNVNLVIVDAGPYYRKRRKA